MDNGRISTLRRQRGGGRLLGGRSGFGCSHERERQRLLLLRAQAEELAEEAYLASYGYAPVEEGPGIETVPMPEWWSGRSAYEMGLRYSRPPVRDKIADKVRHLPGCPPAWRTTSWPNAA